MLFIKSGRHTDDMTLNNVKRKSESYESTYMMAAFRFYTEILHIQLRKRTKNVQGYTVCIIILTKIL